MSANTLGLMIYWTICRCCKSNLTFSVAVLYPLIHCIELNLLIRERVAPVFQIKNRENCAVEFLYYFIQANLINYMDFKYTVFLLTPLYVVGSLFLQNAVDQINLEKGLPQSGSESDTQLIHITMMSLLFIAFQYLS